jgi:hypothetical protein
MFVSGGSGSTVVAQEESRGADPPDEHKLFHFFILSPHDVSITLPHTAAKR